MKISLHPGAERDLLEAASFNEREGSPALAARFVAEFKRITNVLVRQPEIGSTRSRGRRGFAMSVFPYTIVYKVFGEQLKILVVKHDSRRPGYGGSRS